MVLRGYAVMQAFPPEPKPWKIVRVEVVPPGDTDHYVVAEHENRELARYWTTMLNEGTHDEAYVKEACEKGWVGG